MHPPRNPRLFVDRSPPPPAGVLLRGVTSYLPCVYIPRPLAVIFNAASTQSGHRSYGISPRLVSHCVPASRSGYFNQRLSRCSPAAPRVWTAACGLTNRERERLPVAIRPSAQHVAGPGFVLPLCFCRPAAHDGSQRALLPPVSAGGNQYVHMVPRALPGPLMRCASHTGADRPAGLAGQDRRRAPRCHREHSRRLSKLSDEVTDAADFVPAYDQRTYSQVCVDPLRLRNLANTLSFLA